MQESAYLSDRIFLSIPNILYPRTFSRQYLSGPDFPSIFCPSIFYRPIFCAFIFFNFFPTQQKQGTETASGSSLFPAHLSSIFICRLRELHRVDLHARAHCRCKSHALKVLALYRCRSCLVDRVDQRLEVVR